MNLPASHPRAQGGVDLLRVSGPGAVLRWRHLRTVLQSALLVLSLLVIFDGLTGSQIAPRNLAGVLPWVQWRGLTVLSLLLAGSLFCAACPFMLVRRIAKVLFPADRPWPYWLRGKWLAAGLLVVFFWFYEALDPWAAPWLSAALALAYFGAAFVVDGVFRGAAFCKYLCPIGQFNFVNSTCSPLEVRIRDLDVCDACRTKDCMVGRVERMREQTDATSFERAAGTAASRGRDARAPDTPRSSPITRHSARRQQGCELFLFQQQKVGNLDCTFCLDCLHACPYDNVAVAARLPIRELWDRRRRSSLGRLEDRPDLAFLALVLVFAAFLNAFGMVGPSYAFQKSLMMLPGSPAEWLVLLALFVLGLGVLPLALVGMVAAATRALAFPGESVKAVGTRFAFSLVPLGFGMWAAHYGFHFLTGGLTMVPVMQGFLMDIGVPLPGEPRWDLAPLVPASWLLPIEIILLELGLLGSLATAYRIAVGSSTTSGGAIRAFLPWVALALLLFAVGVWLMLQPMEMRGTLNSG